MNKVKVDVCIILWPT